MTTDYEDQIIDLIETRGLSKTTQTAYLSTIRKFVKFHGKEPKELGIEDIKEYQKKLVKEKKLSARSINREMSGLKFYYVQILDRYEYENRFPRMKTKRPLPVILSEEEVHAVIDGSNNLFWQAVLMVTYSAGLRNSEVRNLKIIDVDSKRMVLYIRDSKGGVSREALLSPTTLNCLRKYWKRCRLNDVESDYLFMPHKYLYNGKIKRSLSHTAIGHIVKTSAKRAGVKKKFTLTA